MSRLRRQVRAAVAVMTGLGLPVALPAASASAADPLPTAHCRRDADAAGRRRRFLGRDRATPLRRWPLLQGQAGRAAPGGAGEVYRHNLLAFDLTSGGLLPWAPDGGCAERGQGAGGRRGGAVTRPVRRARPSLRPARPDLDRGRTAARGSSNSATVSICGLSRPASTTRRRWITSGRA
jgi:hypothetical protein